jgi:predicted nucleic acid-binding protein
MSVVAHQLQRGEKVFVDTNFFIALLIRSHRHNQSATQKLLVLEANECELYTSSFIFYELFKKICEFHNDNNGDRIRIRKLNSLLKRVNFKYIGGRGLDNASFGEIIDKLDKAKDFIIDTERMSILSLDDIHLEGCLDNIRNHNSKPGDSFIASTMQKVGITHIATFDKGFKRFGFNYI